MIPWYESTDGAVAVYLLGPGHVALAAPEERASPHVALRNRLYDMAARDERVRGLCEAHGQRDCCGRATT